MSVTAESRRRATVGGRADRTLLVLHAERLHDDPVWRRVHTHFHAGRSFLTEHKSHDFSDGNVVACLERDADTLRAMGVEPRGFTARAWQLPAAALPALLDLGFEYDASARHPQPGVQRLNGHHRWLDRPEIYSGDAGRLLLLPTTCSLGGWFKSRHTRGPAGPRDHEMVYLHDYDLLASCTRLMLTSFLRLRRGRMGIDAQALAIELLTTAGDPGPR